MKNFLNKIKRMEKQYKITFYYKRPGNKGFNELSGSLIDQPSMMKIQI